jgi:hypothetical protein
MRNVKVVALELVAISLLVAPLAWSQGGNPPASTKESGQTSGYGQTAVEQIDKDAKTVRTLTGCLQQGDDADEYVLTAKDGSRWELRSERVKMASHVGHTVTISGTAGRAHAKAHEMKEEVKEEMKEHGIAKDEKEGGHLEVTKMTHVSDTCKE